MPRLPDPSTPDDDAVGPVPADNAPGHHPAEEQDKPAARRRPRPRRAARAGGGGTSPAAGTQRFAFAYEGPAGVLATAFTAGRRAYVEIADDELRVRYGPWHLTSPLANVDGVTITGPYHLWKVAGPPHLSFRDRGISFATSTDRGVCVRFHEPVPGMEPTGRLRHPGVTVTVEDPEALVTALEAAIAPAATPRT